jgi:hypothetical protein
MKLTDLQMDILDMNDEGIDPRQIATLLECSIDEVYETIIAAEDDSDDFEPDYEDDAEALASAGFGMDEDYGFYGDGDDY